MAFDFERQPAGSWRDRPCWRCGYPPRSLPGGDVRNRPECGLVVRISLSQNLSRAMPHRRDRNGDADRLSARVADRGAAVLLGPRAAIGACVSDLIR